MEKLKMSQVETQAQHLFLFIRDYLTGGTSK